MFVGLTSGGQPVTVTRRQNLTLRILGQATLILNEREQDSDFDGDDDNSEHRALQFDPANGDGVILGAETSGKAPRAA